MKVYVYLYVHSAGLNDFLVSLFYNFHLVSVQKKMCDSPPGGFLTLVEGRAAESLAVANGFCGVYSFVAFLLSSSSSSFSTANGDLPAFFETYKYTGTVI